MNGEFEVIMSPLHPLGSLDDQIYILEDAGIEILICDTSKNTSPLSENNH